MLVVYLVNRYTQLNKALANNAVPEKEKVLPGGIIKETDAVAEALVVSVG